jgi:hypothetical protein
MALFGRTGIWRRGYRRRSWSRMPWRWFLTRWRRSTRRSLPGSMSSRSGYRGFSLLFLDVFTAWRIETGICSAAQGAEAKEDAAEGAHGKARWDKAAKDARHHHSNKVGGGGGEEALKHEEAVALRWSLFFCVCVYYLHCSFFYLHNIDIMLGKITRAFLSFYCCFISKSQGKIIKLKNKGKITIRLLDRGINTIAPKQSTFLQN